MREPIHIQEHRRVRAQTGCGVFFYAATATTEIYTLSLHDALPIYSGGVEHAILHLIYSRFFARVFREKTRVDRSEEHTSELQSQSNLVCRLLLEKKKHQTQTYID